MSECIIITGASSGIGKALTLALVSHGKKIIAIARNIEPLTELKNLHPDQIEIISADIATEEGRKKIVESIPLTTKISAFINNAALMTPAGYLENIDVQEWRYQMGVNVEAPLFLTQKLLPLLHNSRILNVTIYGSFHVSVGLGAYGISKAALNMLTEYFKVELKKYNISVGLVLPGIVETNIQKQLPLSSDAPIVDRFKKLKAEGKLLTPEISAKFLTWLILEVKDDDFSAKTWDIYDDSHHHYWAKGLEIPSLK